MYTFGQRFISNPVIQQRRLFPGGFGDALAAYFDLLQDFAEAAISSPGRYEGTVKRESDGADFARAIELGSPSGSQQPIRIFDVVGGGLPTTPQWAGNARLFGNSVLLFSATDSVADRTFFCLVLAKFMFSFSKSVYHDGRPDVKLAGVLKKS
jgi:hypothetical protein